MRANAARAITELKALGVEPVMITGGSRSTAEVVAKQVSIERVFTEVLPEHKAKVFGNSSPRARSPPWSAMA